MRRCGGARRRTTRGTYIIGVITRVSYHSIYRRSVNSRIAGRHVSAARFALLFHPRGKPRVE